MLKLKEPLITLKLTNKQPLAMRMTAGCPLITENVFIRVIKVFFFPCKSFFTKFTYFIFLVLLLKKCLHILISILIRFAMAAKKYFTIKYYKYTRIK